MSLSLGNKKDVVNIKRECYAITSNNSKNAEITMYGQIVERRPKNFWTGEPIEGDFIVKSEFLEDIKAIENVRNLNIRLDSLGGDAYVSLLIYNRLRELKAKKTVQIDGVAMSGGSIIMCAGDIIKVNPGSLIMIHKCIAMLCGYYNDEELTKISESNRAVDKALAAIYVRRTGLMEEEILYMMGRETYMTGEEAVGMGFADKLLEDDKVPVIAASADLSRLFVNGHTLATMGYPLPDSIPIASEADDTALITQQKPPDEDGEGGNEEMVKNLEELKAQHPELAESLMAEAKAAVAEDVAAATNAERQRLHEIDSIASIYDDETVNDAKYGDPCNAQEMTFRAAQKAAKAGKNFLRDMEADGKESNTDKVPAAAAETNPTEQGEPTKEERIALGVEMARAVNGKK